MSSLWGPLVGTTLPISNWPSDDEELKFYLMARGIPPVEAEAILVQAFLGEAIEGIEHAGLREALIESVAAWLGARGRKR